MFVFQFWKGGKKDEPPVNYYMFYREEDVKDINNGNGIFIKMDEKTYKQMQNKDGTMKVEEVRKKLYNGELKYFDFNMERRYKDWLQTGDVFRKQDNGKPNPKEEDWKATGWENPGSIDIRPGYKNYNGDHCPCVLPFKTEPKTIEGKKEIVRAAPRQKGLA